MASQFGGDTDGFEYKQRQDNVFGLDSYQSHTYCFCFPGNLVIYLVFLNSSLGKGKIRGKPSKRFSAVTARRLL
jgi:hypothetical protein